MIYYQAVAHNFKNTIFGKKRKTKKEASEDVDELITKDDYKLVYLFKIKDGEVVDKLIFIRLVKFDHPPQLSYLLKDKKYENKNQNRKNI